MGSLDGKVAIVTGAGQGVGAGISLALAKEGAAIVASGRTEAKLRDICAKVEAAGAQALAVTGDVMEPGDITRIVDSSLSRFGGIDILVNNAQIVHNRPLDEIDERMFAEVFDSGPLATFRFMKAVRPHMRARGGGNIIKLASSAPVRWDAKGFGVYSAAKQAIRALSRAAAHEWAHDNIRVNVIAPFASSPAFDYWVRGRSGGGAGGGEQHPARPRRRSGARHRPRRGLPGRSRCRLRDGGHHAPRWGAGLFRVTSR
jgi:NAD(P)-dependent dehydrogenase (short-subunit alcohol dehydrogenase family)